MIQVGSEIGAFSTIALSIFTAILGSLLVRVQGFSVLLRMRTLSERGETPALEVFDGALLLIAGLMLLLPGFLTDGLGFLLLIPPVRQWLIWHFVHLTSVQPRDSAGPEPRVIEGKFRREKNR